MSNTAGRPVQYLIAVYMFLFAISAGHKSQAATWNYRYLPAPTDNREQAVTFNSRPAMDNNGVVLAAYTFTVSPAQETVHIIRSENEGTSWTNTNVRSTTDVIAIDDNAVIATDRQGTWICAWQSNDTLGGTAGVDYDILFARSLDNGFSWSSPAILNSNGLMDAGNDTSPSLSMDEAGNCVAVWTYTEPGDVSSTQSQSFVARSRSSDGGVSWSPVEFLSQGEMSLGEPEVACNGINSFGIIWAERLPGADAGSLNFSYSDNAGTSWTTPVTLTTSDTSLIARYRAYYPGLAGDDTGKWMVCWSADKFGPYTTNTVCFMARSEDNGTSWDAPKQISTSFAPRDLYSNVVYDGSGIWLIGITDALQYEDCSIFASLDFGQTWSTVQGLPDLKRTTAYSTIPDPPELSPYIWRMSDGRYTALYPKMLQATGYVPNYGGWRIFQATSLPLPSWPGADPDWSAPRSFSEVPVSGWTPRIDSNSGNQWVSVFSGKATPESDEDIFYTYSADGLDWSTPQPLNSDWETDSFADQNALISGGDGEEWLCAWSRSNNVWVSRSIDNGVSWLPPEQVVTSGTAASGRLNSLVYYGKREWHLLWTAGDFHISRSTDAGQTWQVPRLVDTSIHLGICGNTSPCSGYGLSNGALFNDPKTNVDFLGFDYTYTSRSSGYSGQVYTDSGVGGFRNAVGPSSSIDNPLPWYAVVTLLGSNEMAADGNGNWLMSAEGSFAKSLNGGLSFSYVGPAASDQRVNSNGMVAMDPYGHWYGVWTGTQPGSIFQDVSRLLTFHSVDFGASWSETKELDVSSIADYGVAGNMDLKANSRGQCIAVWQMTDADNQSTIWYATFDRYIFTASKDWQLFQ